MPHPEAAGPLNIRDNDHPHLDFAEGQSYPSVCKGTNNLITFSSSLPPHLPGSTDTSVGKYVTLHIRLSMLNAEATFPDTRFLCLLFDLSWHYGPHWPSGTAGCLIKGTGFGIWQIWIWNLSLPLTNHATRDLFFKLSETQPQFVHLWNGNHS